MKPIERAGDAIDRPAHSIQGWGIDSEILLPAPGAAAPCCARKFSLLPAKKLPVIGKKAPCYRQKSSLLFFLCRRI